MNLIKAIFFCLPFFILAACATTQPSQAPEPVPEPSIYIPPSEPPPLVDTGFPSTIDGDYPADYIENEIILGPNPYSQPAIEGRLTQCQAVGLYNSGGFACVSLLYGTNRSEKTSSDVFYGNAPLPVGSETVLGEVVVSIPNEYQTGEDITGAKGAVGNYDYQTRGSKFAIWGGENGPQELSAQQFAELTRHRINRLQDDEKTAFVFVHGFNVSFRLAAYTTAQLKSDLEIKGPAFFYSWPSNASLKQYIHDQDDADISADNLADFLMTVRNAVGEETKLSIIAHSMGNRVLGQAFNKIRARNTRSSPMFDVGVFASADLDEDLFKKWIIGPENQAFLSNRLVDQGFVYVTDDDTALGISSDLRQNNCNDSDSKYRTGLVTKRDCDGRRRTGIFYGPFETIDLSLEPGERILRILEINHNKYTKSPKVICHLRKITGKSNLTQPSMPPFFIKKFQEGNAYWESRNEIDIDWNEDCKSDLDTDTFTISALSFD